MKKEVDGMGVPDIKYGDSVCYIQHVDTCLWLTYQTVDAKCARMGGVQRTVSCYIKYSACLCCLLLKFIFKVHMYWEVDRMPFVTSTLGASMPPCNKCKRKETWALIRTWQQLTEMCNISGWNAHIEIDYVDNTNQPIVNLTLQNQMPLLLV